MHIASADGRDYYGRISDVGAALAQARLDLREAENSRDALKRQITGEEPVLLQDVPEQEAAAAAVVPEIDGRIDALKRLLDTMRLRYTDEHPDVIAAKRVIADLEAQRLAQLAALKKAAPPPGKKQPTQQPLAGNPVYQQLKVSLSEAEANVASLRTRVAEYESRYAVLKDAAKAVPQLETELTQLNRDYDINKRNYEALVARRESAEMSGEMEATSGVADFRLIDPPRVSPRPVAPNRLLLFPGALMMAVGAGLVASFVVSQVWPTFFDTSMLRQITGLPVLGTVSFVLNDTIRRRERRGLIGFLSGFTALLASFGTGMLLLIMHTTRAV